MLIEMIEASAQEARCAVAESPVGSSSALSSQHTAQTSIHEAKAPTIRTI